MKSTVLGTSDCTRVAIWFVDCANHSRFYNSMLLPNNANQTSIRNEFSYKHNARRRNNLTSVRITLTNCFGTNHVFIYIFHMIITKNSSFYQLTHFNYTNQMHSFELVHTLVEFLIHYTRWFK